MRKIVLAAAAAAAALLVLRALGRGRSRKKRVAAGRTHAARPDTLVNLLVDAMVPLEQIEKDYPAFTSIVRVMIGIVPRCDSYLEIWPRAFKSYNLIVPNLMNAPFTQVGVGPGW